MCFFGHYIFNSGALFIFFFSGITIGAGLIKARGDTCWAAHTCLWYHFETQPVPSPFSHFFHFLPRSILSFGVNMDYLVQLYLAPLILLPDFAISFLR